MSSGAMTAGWVLLSEDDSDDLDLFQDLPVDDEGAEDDSDSEDCRHSEYLGNKDQDLGCGDGDDELVVGPEDTVARDKHLVAIPHSDEDVMVASRVSVAGEDSMVGVPRRREDESGRCATSDVAGRSEDAVARGEDVMVSRRASVVGEGNTRREGEAGSCGGTEGNDEVVSACSTVAGSGDTLGSTTTGNEDGGGDSCQGGVVVGLTGGPVVDNASGAAAVEDWSGAATRAHSTSGPVGEPAPVPGQLTRVRAASDAARLLSVMRQLQAETTPIHSRRHTRSASLPCCGHQCAAGGHACCECTPGQDQLPWSRSTPSSILPPGSEGHHHLSPNPSLAHNTPAPSASDTTPHSADHGPSDEHDNISIETSVVSDISDISDISDNEAEEDEEELPPSPSERLIDAAYDGDLTTVLELLHSGQSPNARGINGVTSMHAAVTNDHTHVLQALLMRDAEVDVALPICLWTPLHQAAARGSLASVRLLTLFGADVSLRKADGATAMDLARKNSRTEVIAFLEQITSTKKVPVFLCLPLQALCMVAIRKHMGHDLSRVDELIIPSQLKFRLNFNRPYPPKESFQFQVSEDEVSDEEEAMVLDATSTATAAAGTHAEDVVGQVQQQSRSELSRSYAMLSLGIGLLALAVVVALLATVLGRMQHSGTVFARTLQ